MTIGRILINYIKLSLFSTFFMHKCTYIYKYDIWYNDDPYT